MHKLILSKRNHSAHTRIMKAARALSDQFEIPAEIVSALDVREKDPEVRAMKEREAVAAFLEATMVSLGMTTDPEGVTGETDGTSEVTPEDVLQSLGADGNAGANGMTTDPEGVTGETDGTSEVTPEDAHQGDVG